MEKVQCLDIRKYGYYEAKDGEKIARHFPCVRSIENITIAPEIKKDGDVYRKGSIKLHINEDEWFLLKDSPETREYLKQFFAFPPSFDEAP